MGLVWWQSSWKVEQSEDLSLNKPSAAGTLYSITVNVTLALNVSLFQCYVWVTHSCLWNLYRTYVVLITSVFVFTLLHGLIAMISNIAVRLLIQVTETSSLISHLITTLIFHSNTPAIILWFWLYLKWPQWTLPVIFLQCCCCFHPVANLIVLYIIMDFPPIFLMEIIWT